MAIYEGFVDIAISVLPLGFGGIGITISVLMEWLLVFWWLCYWCFGGWLCYWCFGGFVIGLLVGCFGGITISVLMEWLLVFWWLCYWCFGGFVIGGFAIGLLVALLLVFW